METITLSSGNEVPAIGFGPGIYVDPVHKIKAKSKIYYYIKKIINKFYLRKKTQNLFVNSVVSAYRNGIRLLDYSNSYGNLNLIEEALKKIGKEKRNELIITTRISNAAQFSGNVREEVLNTIEKWGLDYIDLLQFHWPVDGKYIDTWKEMIKLKEEGLVRILGVANCHPHHIEALEEATGVIPEINQVEIHPLLSQKNLIEYSKKKAIVLEAYTPLARYDERLMKLPIINRLSKKYQKTAGQIILRWHVQNGVIPIMSSRRPIHIQENVNIFDFNISEEDMQAIDKININSRLRYDPDNCDFTIL